MLPQMGQIGGGLPFAPRFSYSGPYNRLPANPNPLSAGAKPNVTKADTSGVQQALAKVGSMCRSATGEGKKKFKVNTEDSAVGDKAFESLDRFKRAGLNSFQASFFSRMVAEGKTFSQVKAAIDQAAKQFGQKVAAELKEGMQKIAAIPGLPATGGLENLPGTKEPYHYGGDTPAMGYPPMGGVVSSAVKNAPAALNTAVNLGKGLMSNPAAKTVAPKITTSTGIIGGAAPAATAATAATNPGLMGKVWQGVKGTGKFLSNPMLSIPLGFGSGYLGQLAGNMTTGNQMANFVDQYLKKYNITPESMENLNESTKRYNAMFDEKGGLNISNLFQQNSNWLLPLLMAMGVGGIGGGALGGTGGAIGGAIGLPLMYYLMQNPDALNKMLGQGAGAQAPAPTTAPTPATAPTPTTAPAPAPAATNNPVAPGTTGTAGV
jgi:hypothetical protein